MATRVATEIIAGMAILLTEMGMPIVLRNPVEAVDPREIPNWYLDFLYFTQESLKAFPYNSQERRIIDPYSVDMEDLGRVEGGMMEWVFLRGRLPVSQSSRVGINNSFYAVKEVRGGLFDGVNPRIAHVVIEL